MKLFGVRLGKGCLDHIVNCAIVEGYRKQWCIVFRLVNSITGKRYVDGPLDPCVIKVRVFVVGNRARTLFELETVQTSILLCSSESSQLLCLEVRSLENIAH